MKTKIFAAIVFIGVLSLITLFIPFLGIVLLFVSIVWMISLSAYKILKNMFKKDEKKIIKTEIIIGFILIGASAIVTLLTLPMMEVLGIAILLTGLMWLIWGLSG